MWKLCERQAFIPFTRVAVVGVNGVLRFVVVSGLARILTVHEIGRPAASMVWYVKYRHLYISCACDNHTSS